jgi:hypothetical protein
MIGIFHKLGVQSAFFGVARGQIIGILDLKRRTITCAHVAKLDKANVDFGIENIPTRKPIPM